MKTENELIAEFMGYRYDSGRVILNGNLSWSYCRFDTSWDWLMPVVEKINSLYSENFPPDFVQRMLSGDKEIIDHHYMDVIAIPLASSISEAYANTVTFIKWYNSKNS